MDLWGGYGRHRSNRIEELEIIVREIRLFLQEEGEFLTLGQAKHLSLLLEREESQLKELVSKRDNTTEEVVHDGRKKGV